MVDVARLGLAVDSSQVEKGTVSLHQLTGAAGQASAAAQKLAGASQAEAAGHRAATAATAAHTAAINANNAAMRMGNHVRTNMIYQLNDVGVSLASGMSPFIVAVQQVPQMLQFGLRPALESIVGLGKSLVTTFWPVAAAIAAVTAGIAGLTYEFNKTAEVQVGFFDVALAGWQLLAEGIGSTLAPVFGWIVDRFQQLWDFLAPILKNTGNAIIGAFVGAYAAITEVWGQLPAAMGDVVYSAAQNAINGVIYMVRNVQIAINTFLADIDKGLVSIGAKATGMNVGITDFVSIDNPYAGAASGAAGAASSAFGNAMSTDYLGGLGDAWSKRAQEIARTRQEMDALGGSTKAANDNAKELATDGLGKIGEFGKSVLSTLSSGFADMFKGLLKGTTSVTDALSQLLSKLGDLFIDQAFNMLFGGMGGGIGMGRGGLLGGMIIPGILHGGGEAGADGYGHGRSFDATTWANAPRYHNGGIAGLRPNEVPAILERGERVIPANQSHGNDNRPVSITVQVVGAKGNAEIQQMVAAGVSQGLKSYDRQLPNRIADINMRTG